jgi:pimeloyl-ACP methyl ester carboxylesterase
MRKLSWQVNVMLTTILMTCLYTEPVAAQESAPHVTSGYASVNGLKMYYESHGAAHGKNPPLVLLHGGGSTIDTAFGRVLPSLAKTRQVIAFEQPGHGRTAEVERPFTFEQSADDAAALLQHLNIKSADLFGFSNGGHIALQVGIRHPKLVRKLVVASAGFKRDGYYPQFWEGSNEMDPPLCGLALMSHNGSRSHHNHSTIGARASITASATFGPSA